MKKILIINFVFMLLSSTIMAQTSVYVVPHPDDWQLFMNPNAYNSVKTEPKVIFLHITAGDAGLGTGTNKFYLAREEGSVRALRFMSNTFNSGTVLGANMSPRVVQVNGHNILRTSYRNIVAYFLRLPDGSPGGGGYSRHNFSSVQKLFRGETNSIRAIDGSTTYNSIDDLQNTIRILIENERTGSLTFHAADTNNSINPGDHSDHVFCSSMIQNVANAIGGVTIKLYQEYNTSNKAQNISNDEFMLCAGTWGVTASGISDKFHYSTWDGSHNAWIGKQYFRTTSSGAGGPILPPVNNNQNLALNKNVNSSSHEGNHISTFANDGIKNLNNWWGANPSPQWWQVDLGNIYNLNEVKVFNYYDGTRYYQYDIQASADGLNWKEIVNFTRNTTPATSAGNSFNLNNERARYLRINMRFNSANPGVHIIEFEAYGSLSFKGNDDNTSLRVGNSDYFFSQNPISLGQDIVLNIKGEKSQNAIVDIFSLDGQKLLSEKLFIQKGLNKMNISSEEIKSAGMYILNIKIGNSIRTEKIVFSQF